MQVSAAHTNLAVGVGKYVKKVEIIWFGGGRRDMALFCELDLAPHHGCFK